MQPSASSIWKGIIKTREVLREGCEINLGNGESTDFWRAQWLHGSVPIKICSEVMLQAGGWPTVSHFLANGVWSLPQLANATMA